MTTILVIHGAGMDMRGKTQIEVFGPMTLPEYDAAIRGYAAALGVSVVIVQSNEEAVVVARLREAEADPAIDAAIINPAGFTRGHPALVAAIAAARFPVIEVHISNPARRGLISEVAGASRGAVAGFGVAGYRLAMQGLLEILPKP
jgi:3-dehydroquinate dehydratase-2